MQTGLRDADGDANLWKKFGTGWQSKKKVLRNPLSSKHSWINQRICDKKKGEH